jgi:hypothetical protein
MWLGLLVGDKVDHGLGNQRFSELWQVESARKRNRKSRKKRK